MATAWRLNSSGLLYLVYVDDGKLMYRVRSTAGDWSASATCLEADTGRVYLGVGDQDRLFLFWTLNQFSYGFQVSYAEKPQSGAWSDPATLDGYIGDGDRITLAVGPDDSLHLGWWDDGKLFYRKRFGNGNWSQLVTLESADAIELPSFWADPQGVVQIAYAQGNGNFSDIYQFELDFPQTRQQASASRYWFRPLCTSPPWHIRPG